MPTIVAKETIVPLLAEEWAAVAEMCSSLQEPEFMMQSCLPGWTVKDQLSHITGIDTSTEAAAERLSTTRARSVTSTR